eukprot:52740-Amphidinium_carterae.1
MLSCFEILPQTAASLYLDGTSSTVHGLGSKHRIESSSSIGVATASTTGFTKHFKYCHIKTSIPEGYVCDELQYYLPAAFQIITYDCMLHSKRATLELSVSKTLPNILDLICISNS